MQTSHKLIGLLTAAALTAVLGLVLSQVVISLAATSGEEFMQLCEVAPRALNDLIPFLFATSVLVVFGALLFGAGRTVKTGVAAVAAIGVGLLVFVTPPQTANAAPSCLYVDGSNAMTANLNMGGFNLTNLDDIAINATDTLSIDGGSVIVNDASGDYDFTVETDNNAQTLVVDGGTDQVRVGGNLIANTGRLLVYQMPSIAADNSPSTSWWTSGTTTIPEAAAYTETYGAYFGQTTWAGVAGGAAETLGTASTVYIAGPAVQGANITLTTPLALKVASGTSQFGGPVTLTTGQIFVAPSGVQETPSNYYRAYSAGVAGDPALTTTAGKAFDAYFAQVTDEGAGEIGGFIGNFVLKNSTGAGTSQGFGADLIMDVQVRDAKYYGLTIQARNTLGQTAQEKGGARVIASSGGKATYGMQVSGTQGYTDAYYLAYNPSNAVVFEAGAGDFGGAGAFGFGAAAQNFAYLLVDMPALTATANVEFHRVYIRGTNTITVPTGTAGIVTSLNIEEPNITATGTVTNAATVRIANAPTEGSTINAALWVDAGQVLLDDGVRIGAYSTNNLIDDASNGAGSATLYIGNASINVTSDARVKYNIAPFTGDALALLGKLAVVEYDQDLHRPLGNVQHYTNLLAQNVYEVAPWAVNTQGASGLPWQVNYGLMTGLQVSAIQQLDSRTNDMQAQIDALKAELAVLRANRQN